MHTQINIIGAGKLGKTLGFLLCKEAHIQIAGVCNTTKESAIHAIEFMGDGTYCAVIESLPAADITFICTPDDAIPEVVHKLCTNPHINAQSVVVHFSGALPSTVLAPLKAHGASIASLHPMKSFANPSVSIQHYQGTYCAIEGDDDAIRGLTPLFEAIGSIVYSLDKHKKATYHAAGVFASNYLITLAKEATHCLTHAAVAEETALNLVIDLMQSSLQNLKATKSLEKSLTGPFQRGDTATIEKHLNSMPSDAQKSIYRTLGQATLPLTHLDDKQKQRVHKALATEDS